MNQEKSFTDVGKCWEKSVAPSKRVISLLALSGAIFFGPIAGAQSFDSLSRTGFSVGRDTCAPLMASVWSYNSTSRQSTWQSSVQLAGIPFDGGAGAVTREIARHLEASNLETAAAFFLKTVPNRLRSKGLDLGDVKFNGGFLEVDGAPNYRARAIQFSKHQNTSGYPLHMHSFSFELAAGNRPSLHYLVQIKADDFDNSNKMAVYMLLRPMFDGACEYRFGENRFGETGARSYLHELKQP